MYFNENAKHKLPHLHSEYGEYKAVFSLDGKILEGKLPTRQRKLVEVWIDLHEDELNALWKSMQVYKEFFKINPLI